MSPIENDRFVELVMSRLQHPIDEVWGPVAPNVRARLREPALAYSVASLADSLELAQEGLGRSLMSRFLEDPEGICPPYWPPHRWPPRGGGDGGPPPPGEEPIDPVMLGASLIYVAQFLGSEALAKVAVEGGEQMIG